MKVHYTQEKGRKSRGERRKWGDAAQVNQISDATAWLIVYIDLNNCTLQTDYSV